MKQKLIHIIIIVIFLLLFCGHVVNDISMWFPARRKKKNTNNRWIPIAVRMWQRSRNHHHHHRAGTHWISNKSFYWWLWKQMTTDAMRMISIHFQRHKISTNFPSTCYDRSNTNISQIHDFPPNHIPTYSMEFRAQRHHTNQRHFWQEQVNKRNVSIKTMLIRII